MIPTYAPPEGYYDQPFHWIYDASGLTDGSNALNLSQYIQGGWGDFVLRRIVGIGTCINNTSGQYQIRDRSGQYVSSDPLYLSAATDEIPIIPELYYEETGQIRFDLYDVLRLDPISGSFQQSQLLGAAGSSTGFSLAIDGTTLVVGDKQGNQALVYTLTGSTWSLSLTLTGSDTVPGDGFGAAVAISKTSGFIAVGSPNAGAGAAGAVYIFNLSGSQTQKLTEADAGVTLFGSALAINNTDLLIGAPGGISGSGNVYYFTESAGSWSKTQGPFQAGDTATGDFFGSTLSISGTTAAIGAYGNSNGKAYIYNLAAGTWSQTAELTPDSPDTGFGYGVFLASDSLAFITAKATSCYVFGLSGVWSKTQRIASGFGTAITGTTTDLFVGSGGAGQYVNWYQLDIGVWTFKQQLFTTSGGNGFGNALVMSGSDVIIGSPFSLG